MVIARSEFAGDGEYLLDDAIFTIPSYPNFGGAVKDLEEPTIRQTLHKASPSVHDSLEGEAILSIGKSIDYIERGVNAIINVMPFTCMPGTIVSALMKRLRQAKNNIPVLNIAFDGQQQTNTRTRLEAFIYQAKQFKPRV